MFTITTFVQRAGYMNPFDRWTNAAKPVKGLIIRSPYNTHIIPAESVLMSPEQRTMATYFFSMLVCSTGVIGPDVLFISRTSILSQTCATTRSRWSLSGGLPTWEVPAKNKFLILRCHL